MTHIKCCRVCENKHIVEFLDLGNQPPANSLLKTATEKETLYPLSLSWCPECNLVQLNYTVDPKKLFSNYVWVTGTSHTAQDHAQMFYRGIVTRVHDLNKGYVLEVASNDGTFLQPFVKNKYRVLGVDPAENIVKIAIEQGIPTKCNFFGVQVAEEILKQHGPAKVVIARNVLPHVAHLHDFVDGLSRVLETDGLLALEVHYAGRIYDELHYDSIYHEHLCYFTLKSVEALLHRFGLFVVDINESPISGGSLILYVKKNKEAEAHTVQSCRDTERKKKLNDLSSWQDFSRRVHVHREQLLKMMKEVTDASGPLVGYGASARSSTLLNYCGIDTQYISLIADQNLLKHKRYTAGTHIPIDGPEQVMSKNPKCVFILAWNFTDEIITILKKRFNYTGTCIIPLPNTPTMMSVCDYNADKRKKN